MLIKSTQRLDQLNIFYLSVLILTFTTGLWGVCCFCYGRNNIKSVNELNKLACFSIKPHPLHTVDDQGTLVGLRVSTSSGQVSQRRVGKSVNSIRSNAVFKKITR